VDLPADALTAPLASILQPDKDFESLDFLVDHGAGSHRLHLECVHLHPAEQRGEKGEEDNGWPGVRRHPALPPLGLSFQSATPGKGRSATSLSAGATPSDGYCFATVLQAETTSWGRFGTVVLVD
jgi:hypothetical protein